MDLLKTTLVLMYVPQTKGDNIILGKPSKQSSDYWDGSYSNSTNANDGSISTSSCTNYQQSPYWQGDLLEYYRIFNITVTGTFFADYIHGAFIGVSVVDVSDPDSDIHKCGQWPDSDFSRSMNFLCCFQQPMRFVRIWREDTNFLKIVEVTVEAPSEQLPRATKYGTEMSKKLTAARKSFAVAKAIECVTLCHKDQTCHAFSFRKGGQLNCLLGIPGNLVSDTDWRTYIIKDNPTNCPGVMGPCN